MVRDPYEGFTPDKLPGYIIPGVGILLFLTSCVFAAALIPALMGSSPVLEIERYPNVNPTEGQVLEVLGIAAILLGWTLGTSMVAGFTLRRRRAAIWWCVALLATGAIAWDTLPFVFPARVLLLGTWTFCLGFLLVYRKELD